MPPIRNRGVPLNRYDLEFKAQRSRYPLTNLTSKRLTIQAKAFKTSLCSENIPKNEEEALNSPNWKEAMQVEMDALKKNEIWEKCLIRPGKRPVGCKWVFIIKYKADGTVQRYKVRLVAKGFT